MGTIRLVSGVCFGSQGVRLKYTANTASMTPPRGSASELTIARALPRASQARNARRRGESAGNARVTRAVIVCKHRFIYSAPRGIRGPPADRNNCSGMRPARRHLSPSVEQISVHARELSIHTAPRPRRPYLLRRCVPILSPGRQRIPPRLSERVPHFFFSLSILLSFATANTGSKRAGRPKSNR